MHLANSNALARLLLEHVSVQVIKSLLHVAVHGLAGLCAVALPKRGKDLLMFRYCMLLDLLEGAGFAPA